MPQINLLKQQKKNSVDVLQTVASFSVKFLTFILVAVIAYYGYLFYKTHEQDTAMAKLQQDIIAEQKNTVNIDDQNELYTRQQQLQQLLTLVNSHTYWSNLLPSLAEVTLKSSNYLTLQAMNDGTLSLSITVPSTQDLDKFLQIFDLPEFNKNFYDIKVGSIGKTQVGNQLLTKFDVAIKYSPSILQFNNGKK